MAKAQEENVSIGVLQQQIGALKVELEASERDSEHMSEELRRAEMSARRDARRAQELGDALKALEQRSSALGRDEAQASAAFVALERQYEREKGEWGCAEDYIGAKCAPSKRTGGAAAERFEKMRSEHDHVVGLLERKVELEGERNAALVADAEAIHEKMQMEKQDSAKVLAMITEQLSTQHEILAQTRDELAETQARHVDLLRLSLDKESDTLDGIEVFCSSNLPLLKDKNTSNEVRMPLVAESTLEKVRVAREAVWKELVESGEVMGEYDDDSETDAEEDSEDDSAS